EKLAPADPGPKGALCILLGAQGRLAESENVARQALALDPLGVIRYLNLARILIGGGRYDEAEAALRKAVALQPAAARLHVHLTTIDVLRGDATGALHDAQLEPPGSWRDYALALAQQAQSDRVAAGLKRGNVYKVAVAYAIVGWLVVQISSTVLPTFHAPEWVVQTLVVLVALGFPIAVVIAWAFELTPEGLKRTEDVDRATEKRG